MANCWKHGIQDRRRKVYSRVKYLPTALRGASLSNAVPCRPTVILVTTACTARVTFFLSQAAAGEGTLQACGSVLAQRIPLHRQPG